MFIINASLKIARSGRISYRRPCFGSMWMCLNREMSQISSVSIEWIKRARAIVPELTDDRHKGQAGRIGVIGGSLEYTGAPYFAAITALKVGADLVHVFCMKDAATVIKSYSPELIVHPLLDGNEPIESIRPWLDRLHVLVIGPGLGRDESVLATVAQLIQVCKKLHKPMVIDADGLFLLAQNIDVIKDAVNIVLTPNAIEYQRLFGVDGVDFEEKMNRIGSEGKTVLLKGATDKIYTGSCSTEYLGISGGSGRRCGGQGDLLSGSIATMLCWAYEFGEEEPAKVACYAASHFVKELNACAFRDKGRSMTASDMLEQIHSVFQYTFERSE